MSKRRKGFPSETKVKRGVRIVHGQRKRLHVKPVKPPKPFAPTIQKVKEIVPAKVIPKLKRFH
jgi:hypothetical protein